MSKYYVPVEIDGKWWVVENAPGEEMHLANRATRYYAALESCTRYPTLESDSAYWASKAGVKMTSDEFVLKEIETDQQIGEMLTAGGDKEPAYHWELTALPKKSPTTKELIEQEAERRYQFKTSGYLPERSFFNNEQSNKISGFIDGGTFALSLPKQDNGDAWDEADKAASLYANEATPSDIDFYQQAVIWREHYTDYLKQHYSISKIK